MSLNLPYPSIVFVPLDPLNAEELNQIVENYTYIADVFPIGASNIASSAVTTGKINAKAVTEAKIADGAITEDKLGDGSVTANKIAAGVIPSVPVFSYDSDTATLNITISGAA